MRVVAVLKSAEAISPDELFRWLEPRMPAFMLPRYIEFVDALPRSPTSKIEKYKLTGQGLGPTAWDREAGVARRVHA